MSLPVSERLLGCIREGSSIYNGEVKKDEDGELVPDGYGVYSNCEECYAGQYKDGEKSGYGHQKICGKEIIGTFGAQNRLGIIKYAAGHEYKGAITGFSPHGHGILLFDNGDEHKGHFQNGRAHGWGIRIWKNRGIFSGFWENGSPANRLEGFWDFFPKRVISIYDFDEKLNFFVKEIFVDLQKKEGLIHSRKTVIFMNGDKFQGDYIEEVFQGTGKLFYAQENILYDGSFYNGLPHGMGFLTYKNGDYYEGNFIANSPVKGTIHWKNLGTYTGEWEDCKPYVDCRFNGNLRKNYDVAH